MATATARQPTSIRSIVVQRNINKHMQGEYLALEAKDTGILVFVINNVAESVFNVKSRDNNIPLVLVPKYPLLCDTFVRIPSGM